MRSFNGLMRILSGAAVCAALMFAGCEKAEQTETAGGETAEASKAVEVHLTALGMHCDGCSETIESTFKKLPGVDSVDANYETKDVFVLVDTTKTTYERLDDLIVELGFDQIPMDD